MSSLTVTLVEAARISAGEMRNICNNDINAIVTLMDLLDKHVRALYENMTIVMPNRPNGKAREV